MPFDNVLENDIRAFGKWQLLSFCLIIIPGNLPISMIPQLANLAPKFVCSAPWFEKWTYAEVLNYSSTLARLRTTSNDTTIPDLTCQRFDLSSIAGLLKSNSSMAEKMARGAARNFSLQPCAASWAFDSASAPYRRSLIEQFELVCERQLLIPNSLVWYAVVIAVGQLISSQMSDRFGRMPVIKFSYFLTFVGLITIGLCTDIWAFLAMRAVIACTFNAGYIASVTMYLESTNDKHRNTLNLLDSLITELFGLPMVILLSYILQDWRFVHLLSGIIILIFTFFQCLVLQESPRWLIAKGRYGDALKTVRQAIYINKRDKQVADKVSIEDVMPPVTTANPWVNRGCAVLCHDWAEFFRTPSILRRVLPMICIWVTVATVYYGISFYTVRLDGDPYLVAFLLALISLPGNLIKFLLIAKIGRKRTMFLLMLAGAVLMIAAFASNLVPSSPRVVVTVLTTLVMCCVSAAFSLLYLHSPELFHTLQRSKALGIFSFFGCLGMIAGSYVERLDALVWRPLPLLIFASMLSLSVVASLFLPPDADRLLRDATEAGAEADDGEEVEMRDEKDGDDIDASGDDSVEESRRV